MTTLTGMSRKQRVKAARQWNSWRREGYAHEVTALQALILTGLPHYRAMHPDQTVRLTEVAIRLTQKGGGR